MSVAIKRVYASASPSDGLRVLVDRLWPRGVSKQKAKLDRWAKELAPSDALRRWFGHDPAKWPEFRKKYLRELREQPDALHELAHEASRRRVTLLYAAHDEQHNDALVLAARLKRLGSKPRRSKSTPRPKR